jgi:hypothetical protein
MIYVDANPNNERKGKPAQAVRLLWAPMETTNTSITINTTIAIKQTAAVQLLQRWIVDKTSDIAAAGPGSLAFCMY